MKKKKKKNIIPYRRQIHLNIGIVVFAIVLLYFVISLIHYATEKHISIYEVQKGQIMKNSYYTGLILRSEEVAYAEDSGSINYYKKEGDKAGYGDLICSVDKEGSISQEITEAGLDGTTLSRDELLEIQEIITDYVSVQSDTTFYNVYSLKESLNANVQENLYLSALNQLSEQTDAATSSNTFSFVHAATDGVLAFYTDGYENVTPESFSPDMYQPASYTKTNLKSNTTISSGQALYKTVTGENWYLMIPIDEEERAFYEEEKGADSDTFIVQTTFKKDDRQTYATASICDYDGQSFLQLAFNSAMVRYISDRYLEVELGSEENDGLKIPNTSIVTKQFLLVPSEYIGKGDNSSDKGVLKVTTDKKGNSSVEFIETDIYYTDEEAGVCYISEDELAIGDTIQKPESGEQYTISDTGEKEGVYNMNKGYAVFKMIERVSGGSNEEYTIVKTGTTYGLSLYDRIALDGNSVEEGEFAN